MEFDDLVTELHEAIKQYYNCNHPEELKITSRALVQACTNIAQQNKKILPVGLSIQQITILEFVASGLSNKKIGIELEVSERTIKNYLSIVYKILKVRNRTEAVIIATQKGLIDPIQPSLK